MFTRIHAIGWLGTVAILTGCLSLLGSFALLCADPARGWEAPCAAVALLAGVSLVAMRGAPPQGASATRP